MHLVEQVFDLMGYQPSHWNKINIHIGGTYGDKAAAMQRFAECAFASSNLPPSFMLAPSLESYEL